MGNHLLILIGGKLGNNMNALLTSQMQTHEHLYQRGSGFSRDKGTERTRSKGW